MSGRGTILRLIRTGWTFQTLRRLWPTGLPASKKLSSEESLEGAVFEITDELGNVVLVVPCS
jgi:hypothetical protein